ncbi:MAG TPA: choice-of-anchor tandem repeat GloVer-containing protein [Rhizomicrobium sp.]|jgi:hypothetical protein|nr:choice-of-anchor tandem repeat GloVer-containing protein [Rhizomicrobium sp.]
MSSAVSILGTVAIGMLVASAAAPASAKGFQVIYNFANDANGGVPPYTLVLDKKGRLVGTANQGGANDAGIIFRMAQKKSGWSLTPLYNFSGDDGQPGWGVTLDKSTMYSIASYAEVMGGPCGSALRINKSQKQWQSVLMHTFVQKDDGCPTGNMVLDKTGNAYGVTQNGGGDGWGSIYELSASGGSWTETILYTFQGGSDGGAPYSGMIFDKAGNLYGTATARGAQGCGQGCGTVYELSPSQSGWTYKVIYTFTGGNDGGQPTAGLVLDESGNLYGAAESFGANGGGTIFELSPSQGSWTFNLLASPAGTGGPVVAITFASPTTIYGTNFFDGADSYGSVFKVSQSGGKWTYKDLHDFTAGADGGYPGGGVTLDAKGNLYGTTVIGGADNFGVVWAIGK